LRETSIGHALINDALYMGLTSAVKSYLKALGSSPSMAGKQQRTRRD
jgi:pyridoxine 5'-phosphate synthase PdxJ